MQPFYGRVLIAAAFFTLGLTAGLPYYNIPFFYDYFAHTYGWTGAQITLGFPLAALPTVLVAPLLIHRFSPRRLIIAGSILVSLALLSFGKMGGNIHVYWAIWVLFVMGYIIAGPIPHQLIVANWFRRKRGTAMGIIYVGLGLGGFCGSLLTKPITERVNFHAALIVLGSIVLLAVPAALMFLKDRPSDIGQFPDGDRSPHSDAATPPFSYVALLRKPAFWLLVLGSTCSIGSIGAVNMLMKLIFEAHMTLSRTDPSFQTALNSTWRSATMIILAASIVSRVAIGAFSDRFSKKWVMVASYGVSAAAIPLLLSVHPPGTPWLFGCVFGIAMGADYMLIPLMAAEQFGLSSLSRAMAIILPANTIGQTWFPYFTALLRQSLHSYTPAMYLVVAVAMTSAVSIALLPTHPERS